MRSYVQPELPCHFQSVLMSDEVYIFNFRSNAIFALYMCKCLCTQLCYMLDYWLLREEKTLSSSRLPYSCNLVFQLLLGNVTTHWPTQSSETLLRSGCGLLITVEEAFQGVRVPRMQLKPTQLRLKGTPSWTILFFIVLMYRTDKSELNVHSFMDWCSCSLRVPFALGFAVVQCHFVKTVSDLKYLTMWHDVNFWLVYFVSPESE